MAISRQRDPTKLATPDVFLLGSLPEPVMDRDVPADETPTTVLADRPVPTVFCGPVVVSVCITCKTADGSAVVGPGMFAAVKAAIGADDENITVRPVQCLSVCKRPATVAVSSPDGYTFLFGDLETESGTAALKSFVKSYRKSDYGLVPWRERADVLRKGIVARVPPASWSPDDGRAPATAAAPSGAGALK
jgi:predicted metal-binding protein